MTRSTSANGVRHAGANVLRGMKGLVGDGRVALRQLEDGGRVALRQLEDVVLADAPQYDDHELHEHVRTIVVEEEAIILHRHELTNGAANAGQAACAVQGELHADVHLFRTESRSVMTACCLGVSRR